MVLYAQENGKLLNSLFLLGAIIGIISKEMRRLIINTGMRTDIPAFYSEWLMNRIRVHLMIK